MSDLGNHHLGFFPKGLTCDFGSKFLCVYGQIGPGNDVWGCFTVVVLWSWPYMKISCTLTLGTSYHCGTYDWFPPPLTLLLNSEGITVGLDSAKRYQKLFRGFHQGTTFDSLSPGSYYFAWLKWIRHTWCSRGALPKGWLPQLVFYPWREFSRGQLELLFSFWTYLQYFHRD